MDTAKDAMFAASEIIAQGRAGAGLPEVRESCRISAQLFVHLANQVHARPGDRINVFNAAISAFKCHVTETWIVDTALEAITIWSLSVLERPRFDEAALDILGRRLGELRRLHSHVSEVPGRQALARKIRLVIQEVEETEHSLEMRRA